MKILNKKSQRFLAVMKLSVVFLFAFSAIPAVAQLSDDASTPEPEVLVGKYDRSILQVGDFGSHFSKEYKEYQANPETIRALENSIYQYTILVVLATWCHDSQVQVPRFYKILDKLDYETRFVNNLCLDTNKLAEGLNVDRLNIERVPTFIFYKGDEEIGRIVESPDISLEQDMLKILSQ